MPTIDSHSIVESGATLADDVVVGPFCHIGPEVTIEAGTVIDNNVTLTGRTHIGQQCRLFPLTVIGPGVDCPDGVCTIGNANQIREHVTIYGGSAEQPTVIGQDNLIMIASQVGPGATVGDHGIFANSTSIAARAVIEDYVRTSAFSLVDESIRVGAYTFLAGYVHVDHHAPPFAMLQGSPYRVRGVNSHNLKLCGFGEDDIRELKRIFRELYNAHGQLNRDVLQRIKGDQPANPHVISAIAYIEQTNAVGESACD